MNMTSTQTIAVIEFMNIHGAENIEGPVEAYDRVTYGCDAYILEIYNNRHIAWYKDGKSWREDGKPATITNDGREYYYNEDGSVNRYSR